MTNRVYITGHLKDLNKTKHISIANRQIILMVKNKIIEKTKTDIIGFYELNFLDTYEKTDTLKFYFTSNKDTILLKATTTLDSDMPVIDLYVPIKLIKPK